MKKITLFYIGLIASISLFAQIPEAEPNGTFATSNNIQRFQVTAASVGGADADDYFMTILPEDGTLLVEVQATNTSASTGYLYIVGYDRRKTAQAFAKYISGSTVIPAGATRYDTITLHGRAADTFYFRYNSNRTFNYQFSYSLIDLSPNDAEPNNTFATSLPINKLETKVGHTNYNANGGTYDPDDYYITIFPEDGTLKIYVKGVNRSGGNAWLHMKGYDRRKTAETFGRYISGSTTIATGATIYDTITVYGRAADTFYFRLNANNPFAYEFSYDLVDTSPNDVEPNNTFASALLVNKLETKVGHTNYDANGSTYDPDDYYRTILPEDGTMKIYVKGVNRSSGNAWLHMKGYDRRKTAETIGRYITGSTTIAAGATIYDTITLYGRAADTFYLRLNSNNPFTYEFRYDIVETSPNDAEPNNSFATASPIEVSQTKPGLTNYLANGSTIDPDDYYRTILPKDGTLKIFVKATNRSGSNAWIHMKGYDRRKTSEIFGEYISRSTTVAANKTIYDTINVLSQAADTFYFRLYANNAFAYEFRYEMVDTSENDIEPNNSFAEAIVFSGTDIKRGHVGYRMNGTFDQYDFYKTEFATNDSLKLYIQATNYGATGNFSVYGYNTAQSQIYSRIRNTIPNGVTIYDSVKIAVTAPQTIYNRVASTNDGFQYQLTLNGKLPGNGFSISGKTNACNLSEIYKALNVTDADVTYHWSLSGGGTINFTDSIATVQWTTTGTHTLSLYLSNSKGNSVTRQIQVIVNDLAPSSSPTIVVKGRYLSIATIPAGSERRWFKNSVILPGVIDSVIYATDAGSYTAKYANTCAEGPSSTAVIFNTAQSQTITFPPVTSIGFSVDSFRVLTATASSGLPVLYKIISGPGILRNDSLFVTATGNIVVQALQFGNANFGEAAPVSINITVAKSNQNITFDPIPNKIYTPNATFALHATSSSGLAISYSIVSGPATISGITLKMTGVGTVQIKAKQTGNANYQAATEVTNSFCIGLRQIDPITGPATVCASSIKYATTKITGAIYQWTVSGGGILSGNTDTVSVLWQTAGTHTLSVKAHSVCDTVSTTVQTISVTVDTAYNPSVVSGMTPADNATGLSLPLTLQWNAGNKATSYNLYVWPASLDEPAVPTDTNITQLSYDINENIALNTPYKWKIVSRNVCTSITGPIQQFSVSQNSDGKPDLILDTMSFPATIYQGQQITVTWRVKNNGLNGTGSATWKDRIYLTPTNDIRVGVSTLLGVYDNPSYLLPGETYTQSKTVTIPQGASGTWFLSVITDNEEAFCFTNACNVFWGHGRYNHHANLVKESIEYNNYRYYSVSILDGVLPDLQVKSLGLPTTIFSGSEITATYTVKNEGPVSAAGKKLSGCPQRGWYDRFFISKDPIFDISRAKELESKKVVLLKSGTTNCVNETLPYVDYLLPDSSYTVQHQITLPYNYFGNQYIYVYTNGNNDVFEGGFNTNNIRRSDSINVTIAPPADLVVTNIGDLTNVTSEQQVNVTWTVTNQGANPPYESGWRDSVFICSSPTLNYSNILVRGSAGQGKPSNFTTGAFYNRSTKLTIPNTADGDFYVFVKTDAMDQVFEFDKELNNLSRGNLFHITMKAPVDLIVSSITVPDTVLADKPFEISFQIKNQGTRTVNEYWEDNMLASLDSVLNTQGNSLGSIVHRSDSLLPGQQKTYTGQVTLQKSSGYGNNAAFIKVITDKRGQVYEHAAENNNLSISKSIWVIQVPVDTILRNADIAIQSFNFPGTANANTSISVNWTVKNSGTKPTTKTYWYDQIHLSQDSIITNADYELKRQFIASYTNFGLLPDSQYTISALLQIPLKTAGSYYLILHADKYSQVLNDSTNENNTLILPIQIIAAPTPDLVITPQNALPDSIWGGSQFYVRYTVQNTGSVATPAGAIWYDRVYVTSLSVPNANPLHYKEHKTPLNAGASYTDSILVTIPSYISGDKFFGLMTDGSDRIYEGVGGEGNNTNWRPVNILSFNNRPAPDLIVTSVTVPDSAILGKDITTQFTIKNIGANPANGNVANALYLSANTIFESNLDRLIVSKENNHLLQPGDSITAQLTGKALPATSGLFHGLLRTNVRNSLYEGPFTNNNNKASDSLVFVDARSLMLDVSATDTLIPNEGSYYKVQVPANTDLSVTLNSNIVSFGSNALQVAYNRVPSDIDFDETGVDPSLLNQQVLLSGTQAGTYFIKAQSFGIEIPEPVSLLVKAIPFSIISISPSVMGKGVVSGKVFGGQFKNNTQIILRNTSASYAVGTISQFVNSTKLNMEWQLENVPVGVYDVVAINPGNIETVLPNAVTVQVSSGYKLEYTPLLPSVVRSTGGVFTYKGKNTGNINIPVIQGDVTMKAANAVVYSISTTGAVKRYSQYASQYDSLMTEDWYLSNKNRVVPFFGRNIAPGEEFTITMGVRLNRQSVSDQDNAFPLQCRMFGYSANDFAREQIRNFEMMRRLLIYHPKLQNPRGDTLHTAANAGSKPFIERMMKEFVDGGLMNWTDTIGLNLRWDCSRCLQDLPEARLVNVKDSFTFNPKGYYVTGTETVTGPQVFESEKSLLIEMNRSRYWPNLRQGTPGQAGTDNGWDLLQINGSLNITATPSSPFKIHLTSMYFNPFGGGNIFGQLPGWSPAYDTSFLIVTASNGITGFAENKFYIDFELFINSNPLRGGRFSIQLRSGVGADPDSIMLIFTAHRPTFGENGVDGVNGRPGEPGSPGGKGGPGNAQNQKGGTGGRGGDGGNEFNDITGMGGRGGDGGKGFGPGGDGGPGGGGGEAIKNVHTGGEGADGGNGEDGGPNGGGGGKGGPGGDGGKGGPDGTGGFAGNGGKGGIGTGSSFGGGGGLGGDGGPGGSGCTGGEGRIGGFGGLGGGGPLGPGNDGASGKKGKKGLGVGCGCGGLAPKTNPNDIDGIINGAIGYGKATGVALSEISDKGLGAVTGQLLEHLDQGTAESSPGLNVLVTGADVVIDVIAAGGTATWSLGCKWGVFCLKAGDWVNQQVYGDKNYLGHTELNYLIEGVKAVTSVPDLLAFLASKGLTGGNSVSTVVIPCDPNEIEGPKGYEPAQFVAARSVLPYTIHFENDSLLADVAAQKVIIRQKISTKADPLTFKVGNFGFGGHSFIVPANKSNYSTTINMDSLGYHVRVTAGVDIVNREAFWIFETIDPNTGLAPANVFAGLLPVNDFTGKGTGTVKYSIKPLATTVTGDSITAKAFIVFDENEPIETNTWLNLIDAVAPTSSITPLPATTNQLIIPIQLTGADDTGGSGIYATDLYVSDNNASPVLLASGFTSSDTIFLGRLGHTYKFYSSAIDNVGNRELLKLVGTTTITGDECIGSTISFTSNLSGSNYQWQVNSGSGFVNISAGGIYDGVTSKTLFINNAPGSLYGYQYRAIVNGSTSQEFTLKYKTYWLGDLSTSWENAANWSCGAVPNQFTEVIIAAEKSRYPIVSSNPEIRALSVLTGGAITVEPGFTITLIK